MAVSGLKARAILFICVFKNNRAKTEKEIPSDLFALRLKKLRVGLVS